MRLVMGLHILAGSLAVVFGYIALFSAKGASVHRRTGLMFVYSMLVMLLLAVAVQIDRDKGIGAMVGVSFVVYMVITALTTVRDPVPGTRWLDRGGVVLALGYSLLTGWAGMEAVARGGQFNGVFAPVLFLFAVVALAAGLGDLRVIRSGPLKGSARIARHLWRMCFAFFVATGSFFFGQADELPAALRIWPVLTVLGLMPLIALVYWLWRVRLRRNLRGLVGVAVVEPA